MLQKKQFDCLDNVLMAVVVDGCSNDEQILDLDCFYHICPNRDWFTTYKPINGSVLIRNNDAYNIIPNNGT